VVRLLPRWRFRNSTVVLPPVPLDGGPGVFELRRYQGAITRCSSALRRCCVFCFSRLWHCGAPKSRRTAFRLRYRFGQVACGNKEQRLSPWSREAAQRRHEIPGYQNMATSRTRPISKDVATITGLISYSYLGTVTNMVCPVAPRVSFRTRPMFRTYACASGS